MTVYPAALDHFTRHTDAVGEKVRAAHVNELQAAVEAIQGTLGVNPQGVAPTVAEQVRADYISALPATVLSSPRACTYTDAGTVRYLDANEPTDAGRLVLVSTQAAAMLTPILFITGGILTWPSNDLTPGHALYLGGEGRLVNTPPVFPAFTQIIATATAPDQIWVAPQPPILM